LCDAFSLASLPRGSSTSSVTSARRAGAPRLEAATKEIDLDSAAAAVKKAATKFGKVQADATQAWLDAVIASDEGCPTTDLLSEQIVLFEECTVNDEGGKCKELDAALTAFEAAVTVPSTAATKTKANLEAYAKERAGARVRAAAAKFGPAQKKFAIAWTKEAVEAGATSSSLMSQTLALFDQCSLTEDGKADPKCVALFDAIDNLQIALTGEVVAPSSSALVPSPTAASNSPVKNPSGGPMRGQFKVKSGRRNNGCWPENYK